MRKLSRHNAYGVIVTYPIVAEFSDEDGRRFFVIGPVPRGTYNTSPAYDVVEQHSGE